MHLFPWNYSSSEINESSKENKQRLLILNLWKGKIVICSFCTFGISSQENRTAVQKSNERRTTEKLEIKTWTKMEKIDNIQKEEITGDLTLKEVPSESEYETETDDEVFLW